MDPKDPWRTTKLLIERHEDGARAHAAQRVVDMRMIDDAGGAQAWMLPFAVGSGRVRGQILVNAVRSAPGQRT
jgi:hypothetical protein